MTKNELMSIIANFNDNDELVFLKSDTDRDGYPIDVEINFYKVEVKKEKPFKVLNGYGVEIYEFETREEAEEKVKNSWFKNWSVKEVR
jgi:hypothetical protein